MFTALFQFIHVNVFFVISLLFLILCLFKIMFVLFIVNSRFSFLFPQLRFVHCCIFCGDSPSGKLVQIEHALTAVGSGQTSLGIKGTFTSVLSYLEFGNSLLIRSDTLIIQKLRCLLCVTCCRYCLYM